jgi:hypothetical protein
MAVTLATLSAVPGVVLSQGVERMAGFGSG